MKVCMSIRITGTRDGEDWPPAGEVVDLPKDEAEHLVSVGLATAVKPEVKEPAPSAPKPEKATAAKPTTRKR